MRASVFAISLSLSLAGPTFAQTGQQPEATTGPAVVIGEVALFTPPEGWELTRDNGLVRIIPPEKDFRITVVPVASAASAADAVKQGWSRTTPEMQWPVQLSQAVPARNGWEETVVVRYDVPPATKALAQAVALRKGHGWTVITIYGAVATLAKRGGQFSQAMETLRPADFVKESFAGKQAHSMDPSRVEALQRFVRESMAQLKIPGVGLAVIDHGRIVYEGGIGVKDIATGTAVDAHTRFMIASNTKGMATLLLATLVDEGRLDWNKPVIDYLPDFRLGSDETTRKVLVKHLVCACTGLPRKDMEWLFNTRQDTRPETTFTQLAATQPTSGFGEVYQYNNLMASAAGYLGARLLYPKLELGAAFDKAMQDRIFDPLGMRDTTLSNPRAMAGNWAKPYDTDIDDKIAPVDIAYNDTVVPYRPAGGAWSSAHDMALYVLNELNEGRLPSGKQMVSASSLLARRVHNVPTGDHVWYGMGLEDDASSGVSVIQHGGSLFGYKSNWFAIPAAQVGVVVLTNSDNGYPLADAVKRRLLELLYDGKPEAAEDVASVEKRGEEAVAKFRSELNRTILPEEARRFVGTYQNPDLGPLTIRYDGGRLQGRATSIWSDFGSRRNNDGSTSLLSYSPGASGFSLLVDKREGKRALVLNDAQHEYVFLER